jgi:hypothetical protein
MNKFRGGASDRRVTKCRSVLSINWYTVITDDEADDMELQEETESVSTSEDADNVILRGDFAVRPPPDFAATSVRPSPDFAATTGRPAA